MKKYSLFDKEIIKQILKIDDESSFNVFNNIINGKIETLEYAYIDLESTDKCTLYLEEKYVQRKEELDGDFALRNIVEELKRKLLSTLALIKHLEIDCLVLVSSDLDLKTIGIKANSRYITYNYEDKSLTDLLQRYAKKEITPLEDLRELARRNFKSDEEIRHEQEIAQIERSARTAQFAIAISIISIIASAIIPIFVTTDVKLQQNKINVHLEDQQLKMVVDEAIAAANSRKAQKALKK